ncbi:MAG: heavy-metal-associated domain-containing protein, partial [Halobacteriota archaeon]
MKTTIGVHGMTCMHCHERVTKAISSLEGVQSVKVSLEENNATVSFDPDKVTLNEILQAVENAGYETGKMDSSEGTRNKQNPEESPAEDSLEK